MTQLTPAEAFLAALRLSPSVALRALADQVVPASIAVTRQGQAEQRIRAQIFAIARELEGRE